MIPRPDSAPITLAVWATVTIVLCWGWLPGRWRRRLALAASATGLAFLVQALNMVGQREASTMGVFLIGAGYVTGTASAAASLPYYVMTGVCLFLGTLGLAVPERAARRQPEHWLGTAIGVSLLITATRFLLEQAAAPQAWAHAAGITALVPLIGVFFAVRLRAQGRRLRALAGALLVYGVAVRAWVALFYVVATWYRVSSTHYNLSAVTWVRDVTGTVRTFEPGSVSQIVSLAVLPQLLVWPAYTVVVGFASGGLVWLVAWLRRRRGDAAVGPSLEVAPARPHR